MIYYEARLGAIFKRRWPFFNGYHSVLLDRLAKALAEEKETDGFVEEYKTIILAEAGEKGTQLPETEAEASIAAFLEEGQMEKKALIKRRAASDKARAKRIAEKQADEERYQRELQHLVATMGVEPRITRRIPWSGKHFPC